MRRQPGGEHNGRVSSGSAPRLVEGREQAGRAVAIVVDAFHHDPTWACAFPEVDTRREHHRWLWRLFVEGATRYPSVWLTHDEVAVSVWIPPGGTELAPDQEEELVTGLRERLGAGADRVMRAIDLFDEHHPRDEPHHYLSLLGTDPRYRGQGHGLRLLADNLAVVDRLASPCYLEASNPGNVPLYERFGFVVRDQFEPFADGPTVTTMWRDPHPVMGA
jgi:ribosomal protein S18 acetylase RimI-like enzyme